jgi:hypothetical protein
MYIDRLIYYVGEYISRSTSLSDCETIFSTVLPTAIVTYLLEACCWGWGKKN